MATRARGPRSRRSRPFPQAGPSRSRTRVRRRFRRTRTRRPRPFPVAGTVEACSAHVTSSCSGRRQTGRAQRRPPLESTHPAGARQSCNGLHRQVARHAATTAATTDATVSARGAAASAGSPRRSTVVAGSVWTSSTRPARSRTSYRSGRSSISGVPARELPNSTTSVGGICRPTDRAPAAWSMRTKGPSPRRVSSVVTVLEELHLPPSRSRISLISGSRRVRGRM